MNRLFFFNEEFEKGMKFKLLKEENNEFDADAIAVYLNDVKVDYVANSVRTDCSLTSEAKNIQIQDIAIRIPVLFCLSISYS